MSHLNFIDMLFMIKRYLRTKPS